MGEKDDPISEETLEIVRAEVEKKEYE